MASIIVLCLILFISSILLLISWFLTTSIGKTTFNIIQHGFHNALNRYGLGPHRPRYDVELYIWEPGENIVCQQCDVCQDRQEWAPMDIADWMAEGLPGTPETDCNCGQHCQCHLTRYNPAVHGYYYEEQS